MVNACPDPDFFVREWGGGGGGSKPNGEKTALIFYVCLGFLSLKFSGDAGRGPTIYEGGGGGSKC